MEADPFHLLGQGAEEGEDDQGNVEVSEVEDQQHQEGRSGLGPVSSCSHSLQ